MSSYTGSKSLPQTYEFSQFSLGDLVVPTGHFWLRSDQWIRVNLEVDDHMLCICVEVRMWDGRKDIKILTPDGKTGYSFPELLRPA